MSAPSPSEVGDRVRALSAGRPRVVQVRRDLAAPVAAIEAVGAQEAPDERSVARQVADVLPPRPDWYRAPALDEPGFPALVLALLGLFVVVTGRGDRRDPKLVRADLDARGREVGFS